jgi:hypothetical protein
MFKQTLKKLAYSILILGFIVLIYTQNSKPFALDVYLFSINISIGGYSIFMFVLGMLFCAIWFIWNNETLSAEDRAYITQTDEEESIREQENLK